MGRREHGQWGARALPWGRRGGILVARQAPSHSNMADSNRTRPEGQDSHVDGPALSRRSFLKGAGGAAAAGGVLSAQAQAAEAATAAQTLSGTVPVALQINGQERTLRCEPRTTLLSALRDRLEPALTGSKLVCDMGSCGACTVMIDGKPAYSCLTLAVQCRGKEITTVEGLGSPESMSDVQAAFCAKDGMMCGFCTPGFVVATHAALDRNPGADLEELKYELSGNICRCGTYPHVFEAAQAAQAARNGGGEEK